MGKFKPTLVKDAKARQEDIREQERLHKKYHLQDPDIRVVEKDNMIKFLIRNAAILIRLALTVLLFLLACIGIICIVYPNIRMELIIVLMQILSEVQKMLQIK